MPKYFMMNGNYFETITDIQSWSDSRVAVPQRPAPHWQWDGSKWVDPGSPAPSPNDYPLKRFQFHAMLDILGLMPTVQAAIDAIPDPEDRAVKRSKLFNADVFERNDPIILQLAPFTGLTNAEIDAAWLRAKDI